MDYKDYYSSKNDFDATTAFSLFIIVIKIMVGVVLLILGIYLTVWAVQIVETILRTPEEIPLISTMFLTDDSNQLIKITSDGNSVLIENGKLFQWSVLIVIILIIFNVIGRAISGIFHSIVILFKSLEFRRITKKAENSSASPEEKK